MILTQRSKGIRQKLIYIPNDKTQNYPFYRLQLVVWTLKLFNQIIKFTKFPKVVKSTNKKALV